MFKHWSHVQKKKVEKVQALMPKVYLSNQVILISLISRIRILSRIMSWW